MLTTVDFLHNKVVAQVSEALSLRAAATIVVLGGEAASSVNRVLSSSCVNENRGRWSQEMLKAKGVKTTAVKPTHLNTAAKRKCQYPVVVSTDS